MGRQNDKEKERRLAEAWGLTVGPRGELLVNGCSTIDLAKTYGTPVHVVNEDRLALTAANFHRAFCERYSKRVRVHYALKCNGVPGVVDIIRRAGLKAEVMSQHELDLALHLGFAGEEIVVNGPYKPASFLRACLKLGVRFIIIDSQAELDELRRQVADQGRAAQVLLRINPDYTPRGMNSGSATGSRRGCAFGLDLRGGEAEQALTGFKPDDRVRFRGFHIHIGTGIRYPDDYRKALARLRPLVCRAQDLGLTIEVLDVGGGFSAATTREMTALELLLYQGWDRLPATITRGDEAAVRDFASGVVQGVTDLFGSAELPELLVEPGRCIASSNQLLLLTVHGVKERPGLRKWILTDGGIGTVTMPTFYECHDVLLCNDIHRPVTEKVTLIGPVCFASDAIYRNKRMPALNPGEVIAIMDSGAYFTAWESSFGFPHPPVVVVTAGRHRLLRRRETFQDMTARDRLDQAGKEDA